MSRPDTYENTFRLFDQAVYNWLGGLLVDYGKILRKPEEPDAITGYHIPTKSILRVMATPERAFAEMQNLLVAKSWMDESLESDDFRNVPLPFTSIYRMGPIPRLNQMMVPGRYKYLYRNHEGAWLGADYPTPWDIPYDIHFWCMKRYTEVHIWDWLVSRVGRRGASPMDFYLEVDHEKYPHDHHPDKTCIYGNQLHSAHFDALTDITDLEPVEMAPRYVRFSLLLTVRAWMMYPLTVDENGQIAVMIGQIYEEKTNIGLDSESICLSGTQVGFNRLCSSFRLPDTVELCTVNTTDNLLNAIPYKEKFDYSTDVIIEADECTYGVRADIYRLRFTFPTDGGWVQTWRNFPLPLLRIGEPCLVSCRFDYKPFDGTPNIYFEVLGVDWVVNADPVNTSPGAELPVPEYTVIQRHQLSYVSDQWNRFEVFTQTENDIAFRFVTDDDVVLDLDNVQFIIRHQALGSNEYVTDSDCEDPTTAAWTPILGASLSKVNAGTNTVLRVSAAGIGDGVEQAITVEPHIIFAMLRLQLLNVTGQWRIMLDNDAAAPTWNETMDVDDQNFDNVALAGSPVPKGTSFRLRIEALSAPASLDLDDVSLRKYSGPVWGNAVPIP